MEDTTRKFTALDSKTEMKEILSSVYNSLMVKGYNPINQIVGYILSEDPTGQGLQPDQPDRGLYPFGGSDLHHQLQQRPHADHPYRP